jgi:hypothetical protein
LTETIANQTIGLANLYIPLNFKNAYVSSWNAVVQQVLPFDSSLQIAYVANHGTKIDVAQNINLPSIYGQGAAYEPFNVAYGKTAAVTQYFVGTSTNYESLQVQFSRRFTKGIAFTSAFTWGKAEGYVTGAQDGGLLFFAGPPHRNYSVLDFDRTRNYSQTITYELPAGKGHRYFSSGPLLYVLGGWRVAAVVQAVSGLPFTITGTSATPGTTQTANMTGPYQVTHSVTNAANTTWFNTASFAAVPTCSYTVSNPVACPFGNTSRNQFRGPGYFSDNVSMFKTFPIREKFVLEARFDAFNASNTPAFGLPNSTATSSSFGRITGTLGSGVGNVNGVGGPRVLQAAVKLTF